MTHTTVTNILNNSNKYYIETYPDGYTTVKLTSCYKHQGCGYITVERNINVFGIESTLRTLNKSSLTNS